MAIAPTLFQDPGSALTALLRDGVGAINTAVNNSITLARDRATMQLNQENTLFKVLENEKLLQFRKARALQEDFSANRLFDRSVQRDVRQDFVTDRNFFQVQGNADRAFQESQYQFDTSKALEEKKFTEQARANKDRLAIDASQNERQAIESNIRLLNLQSERAVKDELIQTQQALKEQATTSSTGYALTTPQGAKTLSNADLSGYIDLFSPVQSPDVQGSVAAAKRELATRSPDVDPATGRKIPDRFAPDRNDPFEGLGDPTEQLFVAQSIVKEITDLESDLKTTSSPKTKALLLKEISRKKDQLRKAPVSVQKLSGLPSVTDPSDMEVKSLFTKPPPR